MCIRDSAMAALPYLLQTVKAPVYAPNLTADLIEQMVERFQRHNRVRDVYKRQVYESEI